MSKPVLFYSKNQMECVQLWKYLQTQNKLEQFIKICVDNNPKIPRNITTVPCIFIKGRPLIIGQSIKMYLESQVINNSSNFNVQNNSRPDFKAPPNHEKQLQSHPEINSSTNNLDGILDFNAIEMGGSYSDKYSFVQENPAPMNNQYQFLDKLTNNSITSHINVNDTSKDNSAFSSRLEELQKQRNNM